MKINLFFFYSNILSLVNLGSLITVLTADDSSLLVQIITIIFIGYLTLSKFIDQYSKKYSFLLLLDIDLNMNQFNDLATLEKEGKNNIKWFYLFFYLTLIFVKSTFQHIYAAGLFLTIFYARKKNALDVYNNLITGLYMALHYALLRRFILFVTLFELLVFHLFQFAFIMIVLLLIYKSSITSICKDNISAYVSSSICGISSRIFFNRKYIQEKQDFARIIQMQGVFSINNIVLGIIFFNEIHLFIKILYFLCLPLIFLKIYQQIRFFLFGPFSVNLKIDQKNKKSLIKKLKEEQYLVKFTFSELSFSEIKSFIEEFIEFNPESYYEFKIQDVQYLQFLCEEKHEGEDNYYMINPLNIQSIKFQLEIFYLSKVLCKEQNILLNYTLLYQKFGNYEIDKLILEFDKYYLLPNVCIKQTVPSLFLREYYNFKNIVLLQRISFQYHISEFSLVNTNQLYYDLFDDFY